MVCVGANHLHSSLLMPVGFVQFTTTEMAQTAVTQMDGVEVEPMLRLAGEVSHSQCDPLFDEASAGRDGQIEV